MGWRCSDTAELALRCRADGDALLGTEGRGFYQITDNLQKERLVAATIMAGECECTVEITLAVGGGATEVRLEEVAAALSPFRNRRRQG